jgi:hypothetical protein
MDLGRVHNAALTAGGSDAGREAKATTGFEPMSGSLHVRPDDQVVLSAPVAGVGVKQGAGTSTSHQPGIPEGFDEWDLGLNQLGFPDKLVWNAKAEKNLWRKYHQIGASMQSALYNAFMLHSTRASEVYQVCVFAFVLFGVLSLFLLEGVGNWIGERMGVCSIGVGLVLSRPHSASLACRMSGMAAQCRG